MPEHSVTRPSDVFAGLEWLSERIPYPVERVRGDTFPITWADDGELYASAGDPLWGKDLSCSTDVRQDPRMHGLDVEKFSGPAPDYAIEKASEMLDYVGWGGEGPKPSGMISVNGVLYLAVQNLLGKKPPAHGTQSQHGSDAFIVRSRDHGLTWTPDIRRYLEKGPLFPGHAFGGPAFVQFGRDNADAVDDFVYAVSADQWDNGTDLRVGRVGRDGILDADAWEWVADIDHANAPTWTRDLDASAAALSMERKLSLPEMVYLPGPRRYLLLTWWLHRDFDPDHGAGLTVLESPQPWGPFRLVHAEERWENTDVTFYCPRVPLKWFDPKANEGWLLFSGAWSEHHRPYYRAHVRKFRLKLRGSPGGRG